MAKFLLENGEPADPNDPHRLVWHAARKNCSYWTDNWDALELYGPGIPCCPKCGCPGFQMEAKDWFVFDTIPTPLRDLYHDFLTKNKERCCDGSGTTLWEEWEKIVKEERK